MEESVILRKSAKDICLVVMKQVECSENALLVSDSGLIWSNCLFQGW